MLLVSNLENPTPNIATVLIALDSIYDIYIRVAHTGWVSCFVALIFSHFLHKLSKSAEGIKKVHIRWVVQKVTER